MQILCTDLLLCCNNLCPFKGLKNEETRSSGFLLKTLMLKFDGLHYGG